MAFACIAALVAAGWIYLGLMLPAHPARHPAAICRPTFGPLRAGRVRQASLVLAMWCAMALAMMLRPRAR